MKHLLTISLLFCLLVCEYTQQQQQNEKNILGNWVQVKNKPQKRNGIVLSELPMININGFNFYSDHTVDSKLGFIKDGHFSGTISKFKIMHDSLMILNLSSNKWDKYRLVKLTADSLQFYWYEKLATFKHYTIEKNNTPEFDQIILSTSGCYGSCPVMSIVINSNGNVLFKGMYSTTKKGLFSGQLTKKQLKQIEDSFRLTNFDSLENNYNAPWTDDETISTTFVKNGKIYKTVNDYGRRSPFLFTWAYTPLRYLYQQITLNEVATPPFISRFNESRESSFRVGGKMADLTYSETFLLFNYLREGKISEAQFKPRFKLHVEFSSFPHTDFDTDGRFYKSIIKGKPITIDMGFNFYDVNSQQWSWKKIEE